jgi:iron(III) transport system ATP-binding protein
MPDTAIELIGVTKHYAGPTAAVRAISLAVPPQALVALLGPSGCGKTTTLRLIAGLEVPDAGEIRLAGRLVAGNGTWVRPESRRVGLVFQDGALFPHLTIHNNIAFGLHGLAHQQQQRRVAEVLELVDLSGLGARYPHQLSGGQQQRVALARALAPNPPIMLLDEPFANLDAALRRDMRAEVQRVVRMAGTTTVFVTHDQEEALSIADLVAVMHAGQLVQIGTPLEVYEQPATHGVAAFVGEANFLPAIADGNTASSPIGIVRLVQPMHGPIELMVRPERLLLQPDQDGAAIIERLTYFGHDQLLTIRLTDQTQLQARIRPRADLAPGVRVRVAVDGPVVAFAV